MLPVGTSEFRVGPRDKARAVHHFQSVSDAYNRVVERGPLKYFRARERRTVLDFARFDDPSVATMIDVGCGGGVYALAAKAAGLHVTAVDVCPGMIDSLESKVDQAVVDDLESLRLQTTYQVVVCSGVLEYALSPDVALGNLCRLVAPGGRLVIQTPRAAVGGSLYAIWVRSSLRLRVNLFTVDWLAREVTRWGLELVRFQYPLPFNLVALFGRPAITAAE
jgi:2-polyprenyl-3-methyl-5-hydroxy-6-metoxy-1,4-benzoquinol methylase